MIRSGLSFGFFSPRKDKSASAAIPEIESSSSKSIDNTNSEVYMSVSSVTSNKRNESTPSVDADNEINGMTVDIKSRDIRPEKTGVGRTGVAGGGPVLHGILAPNLTYEELEAKMEELKRTEEFSPTNRSFLHYMKDWINPSESPTYKYQSRFRAKDAGPTFNGASEYTPSLAEGTYTTPAQSKKELFSDSDSDTFSESDFFDARSCYEDTPNPELIPGTYVEGADVPALNLKVRPRKVDHKDFRFQRYDKLDDKFGDEYDDGTV